MPQQRSDGFQRHTPVDGLGGQGVTQLVWRNPTESSSASDLFNRGIDPRRGDPTSMISKEVVSAQAVAALSKPFVEEGFELGVEWDVAVAVQLANGHPEPVCRADLHDGVDGQVDELATTQAGAGQQFDAQARKRIGFCPCGAEEFG